MKKDDSYKRKALVVICLGIILVAATTLALLTSLNKSQTPATQTTPIVTRNDPSVRAQLVTSGLQSPTGIASTHNPSDKRLFVLEQAGTVRVIDKDKKLEPAAFLDITSKVKSGGEMGLLGLAFHPDYEQNGFFFVNYTDKDQTTVIARYHVPSGTNVADPNSEKVLLTVKQPYPNHNGGDLAFGPDGYLYAALGDGGSAGDPDNRSQNKNELLGKILRLDVDKGDPYSIPDSNPFVGQPGAKPEIWVYGLRNPWRISFDMSTDDLYIADVGQGSLEEINFQKRDSKGGENYGWRCYEGNQSYQPEGCGEASQYVKPVIEYNHDENRCSVTGGYVYRGKDHPTLAGKYFYGDFCNGQLFYASQKDGKWTQTLAAKTDFSISAFGQDSVGEVYFTDFQKGDLYELEDVAN